METENECSHSGGLVLNMRKIFRFCFRKYNVGVQTEFRYVSILYQWLPCRR